MPDQVPPPPVVGKPDLHILPRPLRNAAQEQRDRTMDEIADKTFEIQITYTILMVLIAVLGLAALVVAVVVFQ